MIRKVSVILLISFALFSVPAAASQDVLVRRFAESGDGSVNSWIVEDADGLVLIDAQRSLSAGRSLAEKLTTFEKPLRAILLTHPHPDHFGGLESVLAVFPDTPIYASAETTRIMRSDENGFIALTKKALGDDAPDQQPLPTETLTDGQNICFGTICVEAMDIGRGEADAMTMFVARDHGWLFAGDVVDNGMTPFLMEGHTTEWLAQLDELMQEYDGSDVTIFPGHGPRGTSQLFEDQADLLRWLHAEVEERLEDGLSEAETAEIVEMYEARYPGRPTVAAIPDLMTENVRALGVELESD